MRDAVPFYIKVARMLAVLVIGAAAGSAATFLHIPLGWLIGSLVATALLAVTGNNVAIVPYGREAAQGLVGLAAGMRLSPEVAGRLFYLLPLMFVASLTLILVACLLSKVLSRISGLDPATCFFSSLPGGVAEMTVLADRYGGNPGLVSIGQFLRILIVTLAIPQLVHVFPAPNVTLGADAVSGTSGLHLVLLCIAACVSGYLVSLKRVPNAWLLAGVVTGSIAGIAQVQAHPMPGNVLVLAQIVIGVALGSRFTSSVFKGGYAFVPTSIMVTVCLIGYAFITAACLGLFITPDFGSLLLSMAPGGIAEMSLVATTSQYDVIIVVAFHIIRVVLVIILSVPLMRIFLRKPDEADVKQE